MSDVLSEEAAQESLASVPQAHDVGIDTGIDIGIGIGHPHLLVVGDENVCCPDAVVEFPRGVRGGDR